MSLDDMLNRKRKSVSPQKPEKDKASGGAVKPKKQPRNELNKPAMIPEERMKGLTEIVKAVSTGNEGGRSFSMTDLLKMDDSQKGLPDVLAIPIGGQETDMYRMLERCRLTKHEKQVFIQAIHFAEHGIGYNYKAINLDFPVAFYGEHIVKHLRGSVSVDGESLGVFERTTSTWLSKLYATQEQRQQQAQRGIIQ